MLDTLPPLEGTPNQIKFGNIIRHEVLKDMRRYAVSTLAHRRTFASTVFSDIVRTETSAWWWIENRRWTIQKYMFHYQPPAHLVDAAEKYLLSLDETICHWSTKSDYPEYNLFMLPDQTEFVHVWASMKSLGDFNHLHTMLCDNGVPDRVYTATPLRSDMGRWVWFFAFQPGYLSEMTMLRLSM